MAGFVTLDDAKRRLRIETNYDDASLEALIDAATGAVINHLKSAAKPYLDEAGAVDPSVEVPQVIQTATIFLVGILYRSPDRDTEEDFADGELPAPVRALLRLLRDPACA